MSGPQHVNDRRAAPSGFAAPTWWLVFMRELSDLWIGGKALHLILVYSILLGIWSYVLASNSELSLLPPKEMVFETLKAAIAVSLFICLIIGADSISGERERATFEGLLLTPTSRRQLVVGKFLAAASPWPAALAMTIPYWHILSQGDEAFGAAVLWGAILGSLLAPAFAGIGMLVSLWSNSNKTSMFVSLGLYLFFLLPTQLPGKAQTGAMGALLQQINPLAAASHFLAKILVNNRTLEEMWPWLVAPALLAVLTVGALFLTAGGLRLEAGTGRRIRSLWSRLVGAFVAICLVTALSPVPARAQEAMPQDEEAASAGPRAASPDAERLPLRIAVDLDHTVVKAGDPVLFTTAVTNSGTEESPPLTVAMNIINLDAEGDVVDPEDWSPQRTQYLEHLAPAQSATLSWRINAILDGDYLVYLVVIPQPDGPEATSHPVASSGIHLTVTPFTRLNPGGVLPYAIGGPVVLLLGIILLSWLRRRNSDTGAST